MLYLSREHVSQLIEQTKREAPNEACAILAGKENEIKIIYPMSNVDKSPDTFFMDPGQQLKVMKEIRRLGYKMLGIYHSHLETEAYPSRHDVKLAYYPEVSYVIISLKDRDNPSVRSFKISEGKINEEELVIG